MAGPSDADVEEARAEATRRVIGLPGVVGTAIGLRRGRPCVKVYVETDDAALRSRLPKSVLGVPVDVETTGPVRRWP